MVDPAELDGPDGDEAANPVAPELALLFRDEHIVVTSKPAGLTVHRGDRSLAGETFVLQTLKAQIGTWVYPVHRLDRQTSGPLAFALSSRVATLLQNSLADPSARKEYLTLVRGSTPDRFESDRPLTADNGERQPAHSEFEKIAELSRCSLLRVRITTGRRHQIRRHLDHLAHQVIGDRSHGKGRINRFFREHYGLQRMFLHAARLAFAHPVDGTWLDLRDPLPDDLRSFLLRLPDVDPALVATL